MPGLLRRQEPDNPLYAQWEAWLREHYWALRQRVLTGESAITLGLNIYTAAEGEEALTVQPLTQADLDQVTALCGQCVGENLYPRSSLAAILNSPDHYFSLLRAPEGEIAGYIYFHLSTLEAAAAEAKLPVEALAPIAPVEQPVVAKFQSIRTAPAYRDRGVARRLVDLALEQARAAGADTAMCLAWVTKGRVPMGGNLLASGFSYLRDAHRVWYDNENLVCPYCKGRCTCDAAIYYKILKERD